MELINMIPHALLLKLMLCVFAIGVKADKQIIYTNVIWRHGDRTPAIRLPDDPRNLWPQGLGQLTNRGIKQEYSLGRFLRKEYGNLVRKDYYVDDIYIRSTDVDRALMSAQAVMDGFFRPTENETWNGKNTTWFPVPVHTVPEENDFLLRQPNRDHCPNYLKIMDTIQNTEWYKNFVKKQSDLLQLMRKKLEVNVTMDNYYKFVDNYNVKMKYNMPVPLWVRENWHRMTDVFNKTMGYTYTDKDLQYHDKISQMQGGYLVKQIINNMESKIQNKTTNNIVGYSAHDMTLVAFLVAIDAFDWKAPPYSSAVMVDLYQDDEKYFIGIKFRNDTTVEPYSLKFLGCDNLCPFEDFKKLAARIIPEDYAEVCGIKEKKNKNLFIYEISLAVLLSLLVINLIICLTARNRMKHKNRDFLEYEPLNS